MHLLTKTHIALPHKELALDVRPLMRRMRKMNTIS